MSKQRHSDIAIPILGDLDSRLMARDFRRRAKSTKYSRSKHSSTQIVEFFFSSPSDARDLVSVEMFLEVQIPDINEKAIEIVKDPLLLANVPECTIRQQAGFVTPKRTFLEWTPRTAEDLRGLPHRIFQHLAEWGLPFLDAYQTKEDLVAGIEANDDRLPGGAPFFVHVIAGMLLLGQKDKAAAFFHSHFSTDARKVRYGSVLSSLQ